MTQQRQSQWADQWTMFQDDEIFLFNEWIFPNRLDDFSGKDVLEGGCGGGQHTSFVAPYAGKIVAVDLNTVDIARRRNEEYGNVIFLENDIAEMSLEQTFDVVFSIGVVHHTDDPDKTVANLKRHVKPGGRLILWVYSQEGNFLAQYVVEPLRKLFLRSISRRVLRHISAVITALMYVPVYTLYLLPLKFLPYYEYFGNFRKLSFGRNCLNVFDKLNAPRVEFISRARVAEWFNPQEFDDIHISPYKGVSWRASGRIK